MENIMVIRPITLHDLDRLCEIAEQSGPGFTSLPGNRELLEQRINASEKAFRSTDPDPKGNSYLFVLEESSSGKVAGVCGIESGVGLRQPFYHYRLGTVVHASRELGIHNTFETLYLCNDYTGCSEVCSLYLDPDYRHSDNGALLSRCRFMFMAEFRERFPGKVIAEMRGVTDSEGRSPFWNGLGQHFFSIEFSHADYLTGIGNKVFIAELMPKHAIYLHFLPESARAVIGEVHENTVPARKMLESEGFRFERYIDIFDGGPTLASALEDVRIVRKSRYVTVNIGPAQKHSVPYLISSTDRQHFRCTLVSYGPSEGQISLPAEIAHQLQVSTGDRVRVVELKNRR